MLQQNNYKIKILTASLFLVVALPTFKVYATQNNNEYYQSKQYIHALTNQVEEAKRLDRQAELFDPFIFSILKSVEIDKSKPILELGCGTCAHTKTIRNLFKSARIIGVDLDKTQLSLCKDKIENHLLYESSVLDLPFKNNYASLAVFVHVLEHLTTTEAIKALTEAKRVISEGGYVLAFEVMMSKINLEQLKKTKKFVNAMVKEQKKYGNANFGEYKNFLHVATSSGFTKDNILYQEVVINVDNQYLIDLLKTAKNLIMSVNFDEVEKELVMNKTQIKIPFGIVLLKKAKT